MINNHTHNQPNEDRSLTQVKKQTGATLVTTLVFLTLMTLVSVSATKLSMLDVLISSNEQQQALENQRNENQLVKLARVGRLVTTGFFDGTATSDEFVFKDTPKSDALKAKGITEIITNLPGVYDCYRDGVGSGLGPNAPKCNPFDFEVRSRSKTSGANDIHHRGAGKMVPNGLGKGVL